MWGAKCREGNIARFKVQGPAVKNCGRRARCKCLSATQQRLRTHVVTARSHSQITQPRQAAAAGLDDAARSLLLFLLAVVLVLVDAAQQPHKLTELLPGLHLIMYFGVRPILCACL